LPKLVIAKIEDQKAIFNGQFRERPESLDAFGDFGNTNPDRVGSDQSSKLA
jgi:hypothetical protein